jgi:hypothetical protein
VVAVHSKSSPSTFDPLAPAIPIDCHTTRPTTSTVVSVNCRADFSVMLAFALLPPVLPIVLSLLLTIAVLMSVSSVAPHGVPHPPIVLACQCDQLLRPLNRRMEREKKEENNKNRSSCMPL